MKKLGLFLTALLMMLSACGSNNLNKSNAIADANQTLIIYFDEQTNAQKLAELGKPWAIEVVYVYQNFNSLAIRVPKSDDVKTVKDFYQQQKGVLQINEDAPNHLH